MQVMTVTGPVDGAALGVVLPHEHIFFNHMKEYRGDGLMEDEELAVIEVRAAVEAGVRTIVDTTNRDIGRLPEATRRVAQRLGINVVLGSGWYRHPFIDKAWFDSRTTDGVADDIVRDLEVGIAGTDVRAGIIGEIGCDRVITSHEERSFRAAARAHLRTGVTITTHAARWPVGLDQLDLLEQEGVDPRRVIVGHSDMFQTIEYHAALARRGAWIQFDTIDDQSPYDNAQRVAYLRAAERGGYLDRILLSQDVCQRSQFKTYGGHGFDVLFRVFLPLLRDEGFSEEQIALMTVENPRRALTGDDR
jgi:predicted metal-dependent phosphotriesterase family hydrolase